MNNRRSLHLLAEAYQQVVEGTMEPGPGRVYADDDLSPRAAAERRAFMMPTRKGNSPHATQTDMHKIDKDAIYARYIKYFKEKEPQPPGYRLGNGESPYTWEEIDSGQLERNKYKITWDFVDEFLTSSGFAYMHPARQAQQDKLKAAKQYPYND